MSFSLALKGQELYIITSGLVRQVPGMERPVASYTCIPPKLLWQKMLVYLFLGKGIYTVKISNYFPLQ